MKFLNSLFFAFLALSSVALAKPETYKLDVAQSKVSWLAGKKIGSTHNGTVNVKSGEVTLDKEKLTAGKLVMDMNTIQVTDIPATDTNNGKLKGHLESNDFFAVKNNPEATLVVKNVKYTTTTKAEVTGDLTIKGKTTSVTFPVDITTSKDAVTAKGKITVDRTKYDIKYNSADFFNLPVDKVINNTFDINFEATAKRM